MNAKATRPNQKLQAWIDARKRRHLLRNRRPMVASLFLLHPGEGCPKGRMRERDRTVLGHNSWASGPGDFSAAAHLRDDASRAAKQQRAL
jgi:hypothetical protein